MTGRKASRDSLRPPPTNLLPRKETVSKLFSSLSRSRILFLLWGSRAKKVLSFCPEQGRARSYSLSTSDSSWPAIIKRERQEWKKTAQLPRKEEIYLRSSSLLKLSRGVQKFLQVWRSLQRWNRMSKLMVTNFATGS